MKFDQMKTPSDLLNRATLRPIGEHMKIVEISVGNKWQKIKHLTTATRVSDQQIKVCIRYCSPSGGVGTLIRYV